VTEEQEKPEEIEEKNLPKGLQTGLVGLVYRLRESILPEVHYLEGETQQLTVMMADYRRSAPVKMVIAVGVLLLVSAVVLVLSLINQWSISVRTVSGGMVLLSIWAVLELLEDLLLYKQWQFIVTDKRIILVTPAPGARLLADAIYLKRGKIQVLDTNWSRSPLWGFFQAITGARDVMLSMGGYEFKEEGAQVKGGLRFPDVMPNDIILLEQLIFG